MFTVLIAEKKHIDAIAKNELFYRPLKKDHFGKDLHFCEWHPEGQTLYEAVPELVRTVGRTKQWRAIIIGQNLNELEENPFDFLAFDEKREDAYSEYKILRGERYEIPSYYEYCRKNGIEEDNDGLNLWKKACEQLIEEKTDVFREFFSKAIDAPLQKLGNALCYMHFNYTQKKCVDAEDAVDSVAQNSLPADETQTEEISANKATQQILKDAYTAGSGLAKFELRYSMKKTEVEQSVRKAQLDSYLPEKRGKTMGSMGIALPTDVYCIDERVTESGFFNPGVHWENHNSFEYSGFFERNCYHDRMRFIVQDIVPETHQDYRADKVRFYYNVLLLATNEIPSGTFQTGRLYCLESENDETVLCDICNKFYLKLKNTEKFIDGKIDDLLEEIPKTISDSDAEKIFCRKIDVPVDLGTDFSTEEITVDPADFGAVRDYPTDRLSTWDAEFNRSLGSVDKLVKTPKRRLKQAVERIEPECNVDLNLIRTLNTFQMDDVREYTQKAETELLDKKVLDVFDLSAYKKKLVSGDKKVREVIEAQMTKRFVITTIVVCLLVQFLFFAPTIIKNISEPDAIVIGIVLDLVSVALLFGIMLVCLGIFKKKLRNTIDDYNETAHGIVSDVRDRLSDYSDYLSALCDVKCGYKVLDFSENNIDDYDKRLRILKKYKYDIEEKMAYLDYDYGAYIDKKYWSNDPSVKEYDYNFESEEFKYDYDAPYIADEFYKINFLSVGNTVNAPNSYTRSVMVRMEEIYE